MTPRLYKNVKRTNTSFIAFSFKNIVPIFQFLMQFIMIIIEAFFVI